MSRDCHEAKSSGSAHGPECPEIAHGQGVQRTPQGGQRRERLWAQSQENITGEESGKLPWGRNFRGCPWGGESGKRP